MTLLTLGQASDECGKHKSTILDAIRSGRLSAHRDDKNQWQIDPAELFRIYPQQHNERHNEQHNTTTQHQYNTLQVAQILERERDLLLAQVDDLKADRDHWRKQATMLLEHQPSEQKQQRVPEEIKINTESEQGAEHSLLWKKLFGKRGR